MSQKNISIPEDLYKRLQRIRKQERLAWVGMLERAIRYSKDWEKYEKYFYTLDWKLDSRLGKQFEKGELKMSLLFLKPITKKLLAKQYKKTEETLPDKIIDDLVWEKFGKDRSDEIVVPIETEVKETEVSETEPGFEPLLETEAEIETEERGSRPIEEPPKEEGLSPTTGPIFGKRKVEVRYVPEKIKLGNRMCKIQIVSEDREVASGLTTPERLWLTEREKWKAEGERWAEKRNILPLFPMRSRARLIEEFSEERDEKIYRYEAYFIEELESREDLNFLWPYRLGLSIEKIQQPGAPERAEESLKTRNFKYGTFRELQKELENVKQIYEEME